jgi:hypothetical protein
MKSLLKKIIQDSKIVWQSAQKPVSKLGEASGLPQTKQTPWQAGQGPSLISSQPWEQPQAAHGKWSSTFKVLASMDRP